MTRATLKNKAKKISPAFAEAFEIMKNPEKFEKEHIDIDIDIYLDELADRIEEESRSVLPRVNRSRRTVIEL